MDLTMHIINCVYANSINDYLSYSFRWIWACDKYRHFLVHELLIVINKLYSQQAHLASQYV